MTLIDGRTALALGRDIETGALDPRDLVEDLLDAIPRADPDASIYVRLTPARARAEAEAAADRARRGLRRSPLDGVPLSWKDLYDTAGIATEGGSALLRGRVPPADALVLRRLTEAGTICVGKTNMTELAFSGLGINPVTGTPANPADPRVARCPGGSSSGAAVSVARGLAAAAMGSDTGGSIRLPAAWNGLVGLKTGAGRLPLDGVLPLAPSFDTVGPLTRDVADAAAILALAAREPVADLDGLDLCRTRLWLAGDPVDARLDPSVERLFLAAVQRLIGAGAVIEARPWAAARAALDLAGRLVGAEAFAAWGPRIDADPDALSPLLRARFGGGRNVSAVDYLQGFEDLRAVRRAFFDDVAGFDAVLMPACALTPPAIAPLLEDPDLFASTNLLALRNTRIANLLGAPSITLPVGRDAIGLPVGLMLVGGRGEEARLLRLARAIERLLAAD